MNESSPTIPASPYEADSATWDRIADDLWNAAMIVPGSDDLPLAPANLLRPVTDRPFDKPQRINGRNVFAWFHGHQPIPQWVAAALLAPRLEATWALGLCNWLSKYVKAVTDFPATASDAQGGAA